ncbi:anthranilate synthase beta subunit 2, chloroplastic-like [Bidens hawaiensis]|uniref:anthranilate synthase beta subunit 2, chloroplastic-like n=1 Tax=Bidens hawaiensis TaxID=980011 RepID=UPI004049F6C2
MAILGKHLVKVAILVIFSFAYFMYTSLVIYVWNKPIDVLLYCMTGLLLHVMAASSQLKPLFFPKKRPHLNNKLITRTRLPVFVKASSTSSVKNNSNSLIVIDNYDSFTYNLCQYIGEMGCNFEVYRNDEITVDELRRKNPRGIVISPGPDKGISVQTILKLGPTVPLFGVCLGLQCIGEAFGGKITRSPSGAVLGKSSLVYYSEDGEECLFAGLPNPFAAARYHRFVIDKDNFPSDALEITAWTCDGLIMAARHKVYKHLQVSFLENLC